MDGLNEQHFNLESLRLLRLLVELSKAKVVLSSTWRLDVKTKKDMDKLERILGVNIYGKTGVSSSGFRGDEVQEFLDDNKDITNYCIIDDYGYDYYSHQKEFLVQPLGYRGFIMDDFLDACGILGVENDIIYELNLWRDFGDR